MMIKRAGKEDGRVLRAREMREERRAQILRAARRVFADKGYIAGSIADIIDEAQIARGTFYLHFQSKREIFGEILDALLEDLNAALIRVDVKLEASPYEQLVANVERVLGLLADNADVARILLRSPVGEERELSQRIDEFYAHVLTMIAGSLDDGMTMGLVRKIDVGIYSTCVLGSLKETVERLVSRRTPHKKGDLAQLARVLLDYNLYGVLGGADVPRMT